MVAAFTVKANAQTRRRAQLDKNTVVKDSAGAVYPFSEWQQLVRTGDYVLKAINPGSDSTAFVLHKMSSNEKNNVISRMPKPPESPYFTTGENITSFNAHDINGTKIKLKELVGKVVVLNFWFIGCAPCKMEIPELNKIALQYANDPNIMFVAIALDDKSDIKKFLKDNPFEYHIVDDGRMYADLYKIRSYPTNVVLDKEGKVRFHTAGYGPGTALWIKKAIEEVK